MQNEKEILGSKFDDLGYDNGLIEVTVKSTILNSEIKSISKIVKKPFLMVIPYERFGGAFHLTVVFGKIK
ncbi:MAG: hypothetical protein Unbinned4388contig1000_71 [Prokaryotic dsDNA virus sp.]|nr:MAG: hypothetical protein Unbinned4388contig1000_71 [Prokaryotic dsDNA virus sp.]|tara:strand:- start:2273 stop:2482 length:210 start_codon:yes stop_codon:yes gene_type:complete